MEQMMNERAVQSVSLSMRWEERMGERSRNDYRMQFFPWKSNFGHKLDSFGPQFDRLKIAVTHNHRTRQHTHTHKTFGRGIRATML